CESLSVTVTVEVVLPSAVTEAGVALTVDCAAVGIPSVKSTEAVWRMPVAPIVDVYVTSSASEFLTVKVATPDPFVVPETVVMVEEPPPWPSETDWPPTGLPNVSFAVTLIVEVVDPSAVIDVGEALTVDWVALTVPAVKVTVAVWVIVWLSVGLVG